MTKNELFREICDVIVAELHPQKILLFGSYARGEEQPDSDIDLLIVGQQGAQESRIQSLGRLYQALGHVPVSKDLLLYSPDEVDTWKDARNHVIAHAFREGRVLYERVS
jgi:uncharacterized protein